MNLYNLKTMYDAWRCDNPEYCVYWLDFVEMAAKEYHTTADEIMRYLQTCSWFKKGYEDER